MKSEEITDSMIELIYRRSRAVLAESNLYLSLLISAIIKPDQLIYIWLRSVSLRLVSCIRLDNKKRLYSV